MFTINVYVDDVIVAADSGQVVSDVPVRCVTGHVDAILNRMRTGTLSWILLTGVIKFVLEAQGQNVFQLEKKTPNKKTYLSVNLITMVIVTCQSKLLPQTHQPTCSRPSALLLLQSIDTLNTLLPVHTLTHQHLWWPYDQIWTWLVLQLIHRSNYLEDWQNPLRS